MKLPSVPPVSTAVTLVVFLTFITSFERCRSVQAFSLHSRRIERVLGGCRGSGSGTSIGGSKFCIRPLTSLRRRRQQQQQQHDPRHLCTSITMVEGHSVHRVATFHRQRLIGRKFHAVSPNGRFTDGASLIHMKTFERIEAVGKNLFCFFTGDDSTAAATATSSSEKRTKKKTGNDDSLDESTVVVHVHFGMAGNWACYDLSKGETPPEPPSSTCRLRLKDTTGRYVADLSAMTVQHGTVEDLYEKKRSNLGEDPLREDANPQHLWERVSNSKKSIGSLIMDQSYFTGPGNIYRAEICFKASIHPDRPGNSLSKPEFDRVWFHTVDLLRRGYETGSILTVDREEAKTLGRPTMRRYIYNTSKCPRCSTSIQTWQIASRTCYACPKCQPRNGTGTDDDTKPITVTSTGTTLPETPSSSKKQRRVVTPQKPTVSNKSKTKTTKTSKTKQTATTKDCVPFNSHCARESVGVRLAESGPSRLTVKEIRSQLQILGFENVPSSWKKAQLVTMLEGVLLKEKKTATKTKVSFSRKVISSSENAAVEKALAGESLAVEHIAELAPSQAREARSKAKAIARKAEQQPGKSNNKRAVKRRKKGS